jgi:hypothetical protein
LLDLLNKSDDENTTTQIDNENELDSHVKHRNHVVFKKATRLITLSFVTLFTMGVTFWLLLKMLSLRKGIEHPSLLSILKHTLTMSLLVFATESFFMYVVGVHWNSLSMNKIYATLITTITKKCEL